MVHWPLAQTNDCASATPENATIAQQKNNAVSNITLSFISILHVM